MLKEKIKMFCDKIHGTEDEKMFSDILKSTLEQCNEYVALVTGEEQQLQINRIRMDAEDFREFAMGLDKTRRMAHNALMANIDLLNRLFVLKGFQAVASVNAENRETYFAFAKAVVDEYYPAT